MAKPDVLIVEDDPATYMALPVLLKTYGYDSILVNNLADALVAIKQEPTYLLLDLIMPDGNGQAVLEVIKDNGLKTKCAITTGYPDGVSQYLDCTVLVKPIDLDQLLRFLEYANPKN